MNLNKYMEALTYKEKEGRLFYFHQLEAYFTESAVKEIKKNKTTTN